MIKKINDIANVSRGASPRPIDYYLSSSGYPWLKISDVTIGEQYVYETKQFIKASGLSGTKYLPENTFVLTNSATPGIPFFLGKPMCLHDGFLYLLNISNEINQRYLFYWFLANRKSILTQGAGSIFTNLKADIVKNIEIYYPNLQLQHHIVNIMESVDNVISSLKRSITKKRNVLEGIIYKYIGAYQNSDSGWNEFTIKKICTVGRGRVINQQEMNNSYSKRYPVYSSQTTNNGIMGYIDTFDFEGDYITWTTDGANAGTIFLRSGKFNCTNVCGTLKLKKEYDINLHFLSLALSINSKKYVSSNLANPKLMNNVMKKIQIWLPKNIKEQELLSKYINDFNKELNDLEKELEKYECIREGLLNGLFTGKIDVPEDYEEV